MGSIELKLNISRVDLIIACSVVVIASILIIGFIIWLVKSSRQNKALKSIDNRLAKEENQNALIQRKMEKACDEKLKKTVENDYLEKVKETLEKKVDQPRDVIRDININIHESGRINSELKDEKSALKTENRKKDSIKDDLKREYEKIQEKIDSESQYSVTENTKEPEVDVMAEIHKMLKETESQDFERPSFVRYNVGKSGKKYTEEDLEKVIRD